VKGAASPGFGRWFLAVLLAVGPWWGTTAPAMAAGFPEYQVKAEMLFRLAEFVEWPAGCLSPRIGDSGAPGSSPASAGAFVIAIAGPDPFDSYLLTRARAERIHDRTVRVCMYDPEAPPNSYHLLFIGRGEQERLSRILTATAAQPVLTVADTEAMCQRGAHIGFQMAEGRIRFHVNLAAAAASRLSLPPALLRLAARVYGESRR